MQVLDSWIEKQKECNAIKQMQHQCQFQNNMLLFLSSSSVSADIHGHTWSTFGDEFIYF